MWHLHQEVVGHNGYYIKAGMIRLTCIGRAANNFGNYSSPSVLTYSNDKILITDQGLHKIYIINLTTGTQSIVGYFGSGGNEAIRHFGQFNVDFRTRTILKPFLSNC